MADLNDIKSKDWSISIGAQGDIVQGVADVDQCIRIILMTEKGSDPLRPEFGAGVLQFIDKPITQVASKLVQEVYTALATWEKRITVTAVEVEQEATSIKVNITWKLTSAARTYLTSVNL